MFLLYIFLITTAVQGNIIDLPSGGLYTFRATELIIPLMAGSDPDTIRALETTFRMNGRAIKTRTYTGISPIVPIYVPEITGEADVEVSFSLKGKRKSLLTFHARIGNREKDSITNNPFVKFLTLELDKGLKEDIVAMATFASAVEKIIDKKNIIVDDFVPAEEQELPSSVYTRAKLASTNIEPIAKHVSDKGSGSSQRTQSPESDGSHSSSRWRKAMKKAKRIGGKFKESGPKLQSSSENGDVAERDSPIGVNEQDIFYDAIDVKVPQKVKSYDEIFRRRK